MRLPPHRIELDDSNRRIPHHVVRLKIGGKRFTGFLLTRFDKARKGVRDTIIIKKVREALNELPPGYSRTWDDFVREITEGQQRWHLRAMATLKRSVRLHRLGNMFAGLKVAEVAHHFGTVPALEIGYVNGYRVALFADTLKDELRGGKMSDADHVELLLSLESDLPVLFRAYYEQIAYYLSAVFFATDESKTLNFCLRVRTIIAASIRSKLDEIVNISEQFPQAAALASRLKQQYAAELEEAEAVENLALVLVNYIYGFFCVRHRALEYHGQLAKLFGGVDLYVPSVVSFLKRCGEHVLHPDADGQFLREVERLRPSQEQWLHSLGVVSAFVAEIRRATKNELFDARRVFVSHHFRVKDSVGLLGTLTAAMSANHSTAQLVLGRHIPEADIRWALLARVWISDYQILILPRSWEKEDGGIKHLRDKENWVNLELLYGQLIGRELRFVVAGPRSEELIEQFRAHVLRYDETNEIATVDPADWRRFVGSAKAGIHDKLHNDQCIVSDVHDMTPPVWNEFKRNVLDAAARKLTQMTFHAWCYFFEAVPWSIVQVLLEESKQGDQKFTVDEVAHLIWTKAHARDRRLGWVRQRYGTLQKLREYVGDKLRDLAEFEFNFSEGLFPVVQIVGRRPLCVRLRFMELYQLLCTKHQLPYDAGFLDSRRADLCETRID